MPAQMPLSLGEAHDLLTRSRPRQGSAPAAWVSFHRRAAEVYANTAKTDLRNRCEAQRWIAWELRTAREIEDRLDPAMVGEF